MKRGMYLLSKVATCFMAFAAVGIATRSLFFTYQPEMPNQLKKH